MNQETSRSSIYFRPHLVFLSQCLPYPPHTGATARTFNILRQLQKDFDVSLLAFSRLSHQRDAAARKAAEAALTDCGILVQPSVAIRSDTSIFRRLSNHARSFISARPYTYYEYSSNSFRARLRDLLGRRRPDLIHLDSLDLYRWVDELPPAPTFCTHHDIDSELLARRAKRLNAGVLRSYIMYQAELIARLERDICPHFTANLTMSDLDAATLQHIAPGARTMVVPNGVDTEYFTTQTLTLIPGRVVFVGSRTFPNLDAIEYLLQDIWPGIRAGNGRATLQLIGNFSDSDRARFHAHPAVTCTGYVADVRPHLASACCTLAPLRLGGGTRLKILDAWAMGHAVISTSIGCEGLKAVDGRNILVRDTPQAFAQAVLEVLSDSGLRSRIGINGRDTVETFYSWHVIGRTLRERYQGEYLTYCRTKRF